MGNAPAVVVHGHFYQPPRENPWTGQVEREASAAPAHDWNRRIHDECYRANAFARIYDKHGSIRSIVNNYEQMSFNFGPTLLAWLARHEAATLERIVAADSRSRRRFGGHGNALAQAYNHTILPLMSRRDMRTQVRWGQSAFRHHFGRAPEGMWLPETACSQEVIQVLIEAGLRFVVLAPRQAERLLVHTEQGLPRWQKLGGAVDTSQPYLCRYAPDDERSLAVFFYNGEVSQAVAFEGLLHSSRAFVGRMAKASRSDGGLVQVVTDGESYGHHHRFGERCLAHALEEEMPRRGLRISNYGSYLEEHPPEQWVEISHGQDGLGSSWSCSHGVGRWQRDCGCQTGGEQDWNQRWRKPLRTAFEVAHERCAAFYAEFVADLGADPWLLRDRCLDLSYASQDVRGKLLSEHCGRSVSGPQAERLFAALRLQHTSMLMFTSCAWFFSDLSGIETIQNMRYAACMQDQLKALGGSDFEQEFVAALAEAKSNVAGEGNGADIYRKRVVPARVSPARLSAHVAMSFACLDEEQPKQGAGTKQGAVGDFVYRVSDAVHGGHAEHELSVGHVAIESRLGGSERAWVFCTSTRADCSLSLVLNESVDGEPPRLLLERWTAELRDSKSDEPIAVAAELLGGGAALYGVEDLLPSGKEQLARRLLQNIKNRHGALWSKLERDLDQAVFLGDLNQAAVGGEWAALRLLMQQHRLDMLLDSRLNEQRVQELKELVQRARAWNSQLALEGLLRRLESDLLAAVHLLLGRGAQDETPYQGAPLEVELLLALAKDLKLSPRLEQAQELLFATLQRKPQDQTLVAVGQLLGLATAEEHSQCPSVTDAAGSS
jgi:alpha-amylase/alpha-mannosidase (GH57 family)